MCTHLGVHAYTAEQGGEPTFANIGLAKSETESKTLAGLMHYQEKWPN